MALSYIARDTVVGGGIESTWGTAVSRTNWWPVSQLDPGRAKIREPVPHLGLVDSSSALREDELVAEEYSPSFTMPVSYNDSTLLMLRYCMGKAPATAGTGVPYTHTYTLGTNEGQGLTLEMLLGTSGQSEVLEGCKVSSWSLSGSRREAACQLQVTMIAETATKGSAGTPSLPGTAPIKVNPSTHAGTLGYNSNTVSLNSFDLSVDWQLERTAVMGSLYTQEPQGGRTPEITLTVEVNYRDEDLDDDFIGNVQGDCTLSFAPASGNEQLDITVHNARIVEASKPISNSRGIITRSFTFRGYGDGTDDGLAIVVTNDNELYSANGAA